MELKRDDTDKWVDQMKSLVADELLALTEAENALRVLTIALKEVQDTIDRQLETLCGNK